MKKIIAIIAFSLFATSQVFAAGSGSATVGMALTGTTPVTGGTVYGDVTGATMSTNSPLIGKTSTGVGFGALTGVGGYAIVTQHKSGDREIGGSWDSTSLVYKKVNTVGTPNLTSPATSNAQAFVTDTGWSSL
jgi:hypothetical protein